jgi:hypothetical protein
MLSRIFLFCFTIYTFDLSFIVLEVSADNLEAVLAEEYIFKEILSLF